jgi:hypothetical protein
VALFCPLAENVGTAAEWAAVVVALLGAVAVFLVSRAANATGKAAKEIHRLEAEARQAAAVREACLLLVHLEPELRQAQSSLNYLTRGLDVVDHDSFVTNRAARRQFARDFEAISLRLCYEHFNRWHVLSDEHAMNLARAVSGLEALRTASADVAEIDLSEGMTGMEQEGFNSFREEYISSAYMMLRAGVNELNGVLTRLINSAVAVKSDFLKNGRT